MKAWQKQFFATRPWVTTGWKQRHRVAGTHVAVVYRSPAGETMMDAAVMPQAAAVFKRFGGARALMRALEAVGRPRNAASIYKWSYPYPKGTGGLIPASAWKDILVAAKHEGLALRDRDIAPLVRPKIVPHMAVVPRGPKPAPKKRKRRRK